VVIIRLKWLVKGSDDDSKRKNGVSLGILPIKAHFKAYIKHEMRILDTAQKGIIKDQFHSNPKDKNC